MAAELVFYTNPFSRGGIVHWMLEELGVPYRTEVLEYGTTMKAPAYLAINPMGKVPAIPHGEVVVTEAAAICAYLADAFPEVGLAPPPGERGAYYRWLFFGRRPGGSSAQQPGVRLSAHQGTRDAGRLWLALGGCRHAGPRGGGATLYCRGSVQRCGRLCRVADRLGHAVRIAGEAPGVRSLLGRPEGPPRPSPGRGSVRRGHGKAPGSGGLSPEAGGHSMVTARERTLRHLLGATIKCAKRAGRD
jgi:hypothetical protein